MRRSRNVIKTAHIAIIRGRNRGMIQRQLSLNFRIALVTASQVLKRYRYRRRMAFQSPQETDQIN